jgi:hypothetical protein
MLLLPMIMCIRRRGTDGGGWVWSTGSPRDCDVGKLYTSCAVLLSARPVASSGSILGPSGDDEDRGLPKPRLEEREMYCNYVRIIQTQHGSPCLAKVSKVGHTCL